MSKHTPGPWETNDKEVDRYIIWGGDGLRVCEVVPPIGCFQTPKQREANARLIAAAPELLAAHVANASLNVDEIRREGRLVEVLKQIVSDAKAAIAKADGC